MELKISKREFINEMKACAFNIIADPKIGNDKVSVLNRFINAMDCVLCREEVKSTKRDFNSLATNSDSDKTFEEVVSFLKKSGIDVEVHVLNLSDNNRD